MNRRKKSISGAISLAVVSGVITGLVLWLGTPRLHIPAIALFAICYPVLIMWNQPRWTQIVSLLIALFIFTSADDLLIFVEKDSSQNNIGLIVKYAHTEIADNANKNGREPSLVIALSNVSDRPVDFDRVRVILRGDALLKDEQDIDLPNKRLLPCSAIPVYTNMSIDARYNRMWVQLFKHGPSKQKPFINIRIELSKPLKIDDLMTFVSAKHDCETPHFK